MVLLGENHQVRENCALVADCLRPLYQKAGLRVFATEFLRHRQTAAMNRIVTAEDYDEAAVVALQRDGPWPTWGFRDYADIFRAVWQVNAGRQDGEPPLVVLGLDSDWSQYQFWFGKLSQRRIMQIQLDREHGMVTALADGPLAHGDKTLVHCGYAHSVTCQGERLGTVLKRRFGERVFQVALHHSFPTPNGIAKLSEWLDGLLRREPAPIGFDVVGSPLAKLQDQDGIYWRLVPAAGLGDFAMGYLYLAPVGELLKMRWIPGFIDDQSFAAANAVAQKLGYVQAGECADAAALDAKLRQRFPDDRPVPK